ncbi:MAG: hypothetical protein ABJZ55_26175 [Fuerstiella sp.]
MSTNTTDLQTRMLLIAFCVVLSVADPAFGQTFQGKLEPYDSESEERIRRTPMRNDLIAHLATPSGKPISGLEVSIAVKRKYGAFSGAGDAPFRARTPSNNQGQIRFKSSLSLWKQNILPELVEQGVLSETGTPTNEDYKKFKNFKWTVEGYSSSTKSRIKLESLGAPSLWLDSAEVALVIPKLQFVRIKVTSNTDGKPLANVRLWARQNLFKMPDSTWWNVDCYAWTDVTGSAGLWLPSGNYRVHWNTTHAMLGVDMESSVFDAGEHQFSPIVEPESGRNTEMDSQRERVFLSKRFWWREDQPSLEVADTQPEIYQLRLEPPAVIIP